jgi:calcineurin-like phosphoesterase family protein
MKTYLFADSHFNQGNIATYCQRPENFTELIQSAWNRTVAPGDVVIHLGDVGIGDLSEIRRIIDGLNGRKVLVRGNHDRKHSNTWWMEKGGFDFSCDSMMFRHCFLTHEPYPSPYLPKYAELNVHGHLHNIWHGFHTNASVDPLEEAEMKKYHRLRYRWQRLFACEYTKYAPVEMEKFLSHPDKYFAKGIPDEDSKQ